MPLHHSQVNEVLEIERLSFPEPWSQEMLEREITLMISHFYVAVLENRVVGYGGYWHINDEAHIVNLAVHPDFRSRGYGRALLEFLIRLMESQGVCKAFLEVRKSNLRAQKLYESLGFRVTGMRPNYYNNKEDAILMEKSLTLCTK